MRNSVVIHGTHGRNNAEKATLPFIIGNAVAVGGDEVVVLLTADAVWLATRAFADDIEFDGHPPVTENIELFISNGGAVWVCGSSTEPRGIGERDLVDGVTVATASDVAAALSGDVKTVSF